MTSFWHHDDVIRSLMQRWETIIQFVFGNTH